MKKLILSILVLAVSLNIQAQIKTPQPSPIQSLTQTVGLTDVTLEYSRPSMKGRTIFGGLVPYNEMWRTGANKNTMITFSDAVVIGEAEVKAGTYAIYTKPNPQSWDVYFYDETSNWGNPAEWDDAKVVAKVTAQVYPFPETVQTFTMAINDITIDTANLGFLWEKTYVAVPIKFITDELVTIGIEKVMGGPSANDYYSSAVYYLDAGKDIEKAKNWIDKAIEMREEAAFWYYRQQSLIYAKSGDKKGAIKAAKESMKLAEVAGNSQYVAMNAKSINLWEGKGEAKK